MTGNRKNIPVDTASEDVNVYVRELTSNYGNDQISTEYIYSNVILRVTCSRDHAKISSRF